MDDVENADVTSFKDSNNKFDALRQEENRTTVTKGNIIKAYEEKLKSCKHCHSRISHASYDDHVTLCRQKKKRCNFCKTIIPIKKEEDHIKKCQAVTLRNVPQDMCSFCHTTMPVILLNDHTGNHCARVVPCPFCDNMLNVKNSQQHLLNCLKECEKANENKSANRTGTIPKRANQYEVKNSWSDKISNFFFGSPRTLESDAQQRNCSLSSNNAMHYRQTRSSIYPSITETPIFSEPYETAVEVPCEFCNEMIPFDQLVMHESGCRPDLVSHPQPRPSSKLDEDKKISFYSDVDIQREEKYHFTDEREEKNQMFTTSDVELAQARKQKFENYNYMKNFHQKYPKNIETEISSKDLSRSGQKELHSSENEISKSYNSDVEIQREEKYHFTDEREEKNKLFTTSDVEHAQARKKLLEKHFETSSKDFSRSGQKELYSSESEISKSHNKIQRSIKNESPKCQETAYKNVPVYHEGEDRTHKNAPNRFDKEKEEKSTCRNVLDYQNKEKREKNTPVLSESFGENYHYKSSTKYTKPGEFLENMTQPNPDVFSNNKHLARNIDHKVSSRSILDEEKEQNISDEFWQDLDSKSVIKARKEHFNQNSDNTLQHMEQKEEIQNTSVQHKPGSFYDSKKHMMENIDNSLSNFILDEGKPQKLHDTWQDLDSDNTINLQKEHCSQQSNLFDKYSQCVKQNDGNLLNSSSENTYLNETILFKYGSNSHSLHNEPSHNSEPKSLKDEWAYKSIGKDAKQEFKQEYQTTKENEIRGEKCFESNESPLISTKMKGVVKIERLSRRPRSEYVDKDITYKSYILDEHHRNPSCSLRSEEEKFAHHKLPSSNDFQPNEISKEESQNSETACEESFSENNSLIDLENLLSLDNTNDYQQITKTGNDKYIHRRKFQLSKDSKIHNISELVEQEHKNSKAFIRESQLKENKLSYRDSNKFPQKDDHIPYIDDEELLTRSKKNFSKDPQFVQVSEKIKQEPYNFIEKKFPNHQNQVKNIQGVKISENLISDEQPMEMDDSGFEIKENSHEIFSNNDSLIEFETKEKYPEQFQNNDSPSELNDLSYNVPIQKYKETNFKSRDRFELPMNARKNKNSESKTKMCENSKNTYCKVCRNEWCICKIPKKLSDFSSDYSRNKEANFKSREFELSMNASKNKNSEPKTKMCEDSKITYCKVCRNEWCICKIPKNLSDFSSDYSRSTDFSSKEVTVMHTENKGRNKKQDISSSSEKEESEPIKWNQYRERHEESE